MALDQREAHDRLSPFLRYLALRSGDEEKIPSLNELSKELKVNTAALREQLEVARALGVVEVRPRTGIRRLPYSFSPAVEQSLFYALSLSPQCFEAFSDLRNHVEAAFWKDAVRRLGAEDLLELQSLVVRAEDKMNREPVQIPHAEHRALHMIIYCRLENPFVSGLLEAYWDMYEAIGLALYTDLDYLRVVWQYHRRMVEAIVAGDLETGYRALVDHVDLIHQRSRRVSRQRFE
jgi:DNA-binding FadR family transcriptional regulator